MACNKRKRVHYHEAQRTPRVPVSPSASDAASARGRARPCRPRPEGATRAAEAEVSIAGFEGGRRRCTCVCLSAASRNLPQGLRRGQPRRDPARGRCRQATRDATRRPRRAEGHVGRTRRQGRRPPPRQGRADHALLSFTVDGASEGVIEAVEERRQGRGDPSSRSREGCRQEGREVQGAGGAQGVVC